MIEKTAAARRVLARENVWIGEHEAAECTQ